MKNMEIIAVVINPALLLFLKSVLQKLFVIGMTGSFVWLFYAHPSKKGERPCRFEDRPIKNPASRKAPRMAAHTKESQSRTNLLIKWFARLIEFGLRNPAFLNAEES